MEAKTVMIEGVPVKMESFAVFNERIRKLVIKMKRLYRKYDRTKGKIPKARIMKSALATEKILNELGFSSL